MTGADRLAFRFFSEAMENTERDADLTKDPGTRLAEVAERQPISSVVRMSELAGWWALLCRNPKLTFEATLLKFRAFKVLTSAVSDSELDKAEIGCARLLSRVEFGKEIPSAAWAGLHRMVANASIDPATLRRALAYEVLVPVHPKVNAYVFSEPNGAKRHVIRYAGVLGLTICALTACLAVMAAACGLSCGTFGWGFCSLWFGFAGSSLCRSSAEQKHLADLFRVSSQG